MTGAAYTVIVEPADDGSFSVYVPDLPGCVSTGDASDEALANIREAIVSHIEALKILGESVPPPRSRASVVAA